MSIDKKHYFFNYWREFHNTDLSEYEQTHLFEKKIIQTGGPVMNKTQPARNMKTERNTNNTTTIEYLQRDTILYRSPKCHFSLPTFSKVNNIKGQGFWMGNLYSEDRAKALFSCGHVFSWKGSRIIPWGQPAMAILPQPTCCRTIHMG